MFGWFLLVETSLTEAAGCLQLEVRVLEPGNFRQWEPKVLFEVEAVLNLDAVAKLKEALLDGQVRVKLGQGPHSCSFATLRVSSAFLWLREARDWLDFGIEQKFKAIAGDNFFNVDCTFGGIAGFAGFHLASLLRCFDGCCKLDGACPVVQCLRR
ncbi:hypothetical protein Nepgr_000690 [Nepenthes gracilis]|uniref:Uncharacterized protein n=1 Tax=Nepenthes gracilis TaxID=150966 RepID=A0AAD3RWQ2_NEPGR|nr:hypothetical protein Nepgr_000690 [Nepenthes gracilis]